MVYMLLNRKEHAVYKENALAAFSDAGYKLFAVTYRHGHFGYRYYGNE